MALRGQASTHFQQAVQFLDEKDGHLFVFSIIDFNRFIVGLFCAGQDAVVIICALFAHLNMPDSFTEIK